MAQPINTINADAANGQIDVLQTSASSPFDLLQAGVIAPEYENAGPPSATTLPDGSCYHEGDKYIDNTTATAPVLYRCTTNGDAGTSVWAKISGGGRLWQTPNKELDPTVAVAANTLVYISPQNPLATVGLVDLQSSGATLTATAGIWCSLLAVPAATSSGYNVPQDPIPDGGVTVPTGSPLVGDLDRTAAPLIYWVLSKSVC